VLRAGWGVIPDTDLGFRKLVGLTKVGKPDSRVLMDVSSGPQLEGALAVGCWAVYSLM
jgi:hypothetical protein